MPREIEIGRDLAPDALDATARRFARTALGAEFRKRTKGRFRVSVGEASEGVAIAFFGPAGEIDLSHVEVSPAEAEEIGRELVMLARRQGGDLDQAVRDLLTERGERSQ